MSHWVDVLWLSAELQSAERCSARSDPGPSVLESTTLLLHGAPVGDVPARIDYTVSTNSTWETTAVDVELTAGGQCRLISIQRDGRGWTVNGDRRPDLDACVDVDLGWTPATNMLPLRRNPIETGQAVTTTSAWLRFPELDVVASEQRYTRLSDDRVRYESATFTAELVVTADGLVTIYGDGLWKASAVYRRP